MSWRLASSLLVVATASLALVACGADKSAESASTLESWRAAACDVLTTLGQELEPPTTEGDVSSLGSGGGLQREIEAFDEAVAKLRTIPLPAERRADAERLIELLAIMTDAYEKAAPRIDAASRRLQEVLESIDPDDLPPPPDEPTTVAGGIMSQLMSVPEYADAFADMMRAYEEATAGIDPAEADRVTERLGLTQCMNPEKPQPLDAEALARCGSRGAPVTLQELVDAAREHGLTLEIKQDTCGKRQGEKVAGFDSDATNAGPKGLDQPDELNFREGHVLCDVGNKSFVTELEVTKYDTDTETLMTAANVHCAIYPHSTAREAAQVARLKKAMQAVADLAATRS